MSNAKIENLLNLALDANPAEREKSLNLGVGYSAKEQTWEVIVRFIRNGIGQVEKLLAEQGYDMLIREIVQLSNSYATLTLPDSLVDIVAGLDEIIYMEKPKRLFFALNAAKRASCITSVQSSGNLPQTSHGVADTGLSGAGCLVAVIDSGIDYAHPDFCNADGTTRIAALWDQTLQASALNAAKSETNSEMVN